MDEILHIFNGHGRFFCALINVRVHLLMPYFLVPIDDIANLLSFKGKMLMFFLLANIKC